MLDLKFIVENPDLIKAGAAKKHVKIDIDKIITLYEDRKNILQEIESLRAEQNSVSKQIPQADPAEKEKLLEEMSTVKDKIKNLEPQLEEYTQKIDALVLDVPNPPLDSVPEGADEESNLIVRTEGTKPNFDFEARTHSEIGENLDIIDIERGVRTSGARFYYLKGDAALLEFALLQHSMTKLNSKGFRPVIPPVLVKEEAMYATGYFPADRKDIYTVNPEEDNLFLVGTSEVPLTMLHYSENLDADQLPLRYCGYSSCFRREAGSYGKDTAGIIRVHQFNKIEMFSFCHPDKSEAEHEYILSIEEEIMKDLGFHYQVVNICGGDLGAPAAKKYDIEVWIPTQGKFRELTSCSNCTDFQARRSKIKYTDANGKKGYLHTLNGTAIAIARTLVAIIENYQNADGSITIPEVLRPYMGGREKIEAILHS